MDYPLFLVPHIGGSWLIGGIAIFHVIIAHFAIGGGLLTVATEQLGATRENALWLAFARKHAVFLVLLSSVLGALSGVGIWFTVGLVHPAAMASLIRNFVWGWAIEWVFFVVEIGCGPARTWGRGTGCPGGRTCAIGWIYFVAAYLSLVVINGIVTFMLTPGRLASRPAPSGTAFFNPTYWPSLVLRTGIALMLAGAYGWLVATRLARERRAGRAGPVPVRLGSRRRGRCRGGLRLVVGEHPGGGARTDLPCRRVCCASTHVLGLVALGLLAVLLVIVGFLAPRAFGVTAAILAIVLTGTYFGAYERVREGARKPYVIHGYMYSNGVRVDEVDRLNREGILTQGPMGGRGRRRRSDIPRTAGVSRPVPDVPQPGRLPGDPAARGGSGRGGTGGIPGGAPAPGGRGCRRSWARKKRSRPWPSTWSPSPAPPRRSRSDQLGPPKGRSWEVRNDRSGDSRAGSDAPAGPGVAVPGPACSSRSSSTSCSSTSPSAGAVIGAVHGSAGHGTGGAGTPTGAAAGESACRRACRSP